MRSPPLPALAALLLLTGCGGFGELGGITLEDPSSAIFHVGADGRAIFVFSDVSLACGLAEVPSGPEGDDWWVISALLDSTWGEGENKAKVYAKVMSGGKATEYTAAEAFVHLDDVVAEQTEYFDGEYDGYAEGRLDLDFAEDGRVDGKFEAEYCSANLLQGL